MATPASFRVLEHELLLYRRSFRGTIVSSFLNPVLYLAAMGVGLGGYVAGSKGGSGAAASAALLGGVSGSLRTLS